MLVQTFAVWIKSARIFIMKMGRVLTLLSQAITPPWACGGCKLERSAFFWVLGRFLSFRNSILLSWAFQ